MEVINVPPPLPIWELLETMMLTFFVRINTSPFSDTSDNPADTIMTATCVTLIVQKRVRMKSVRNLTA